MSESFSATGGIVSLTTTSTVSSVVLTLLQGAVNLTATDDDGAGFDSVPMRNLAQTRSVEIVGTNSIFFSIALVSDGASNEPPSISFAPQGPYTNAVGTTNAFTVSAIDPDEDPVVLGSGALPYTATFNAGSGAFAWWVTNMGSAGTTNVVLFMADDGVQVVTNAATIVVPWDANGNGMPDDWEYLRFNGVMTHTAAGDADGDGFSNYAEWVASTDPSAPGSYIGWETHVKVAGGMSLTFQAVPGHTYHVEGNDNDLPDPAEWKHLATVINDGDSLVEWTDTAYPSNAVRHYRIKIPAFAP